MIELKTLWLSGTLSEWNDAITEYYQNPRVIANRDIENYLLTLTPENVRDMPTEDFYDYLHDKFFVWKYTGTWLTRRQNELSVYQNKNRMNELSVIQKKLFHDIEYDRTDTAALLCTATRIEGLGVAGASGLLSFLYPQLYGTLDRLLVESLKTLYQDDTTIGRIRGNDLTIKNGVLLENILRDKADLLNRQFKTDYYTARKIDMVLWNYGHKHK